MLIYALNARPGLLLNESLHGGDEHCYGSPGGFDGGLQHVCVLLGSGVSQPPLDNSPTILCGVHVRWAGQPVKRSNTMVSDPVTSSFGTVGRCQARLGKGSMKMLISFSSRSSDKFADHGITVYSITSILCYIWIFWETGFLTFLKYPFTILTFRRHSKFWRCTCKLRLDLVNWELILTALQKRRHLTESQCWHYGRQHKPHVGRHFIFMQKR